MNVETTWIRILIWFEINKTRLFTSFRYLNLFMKKKHRRRYWFKHPGPKAGESQVGFVWIGIGDCEVENSNYMNLVDSLELTDKTNERLFDEFKVASTAYELMEKHILKLLEDQNVLFYLKHNRLTNLIRWYIPSQIDKIQLIFNDLSLHKFYG